MTLTRSTLALSLLAVVVAFDPKEKDTDARLGITPAGEWAFFVTGE